MGLRAEIEEVLHDSLEDEFGLPVVLTSPDGVRYSKSANDPTADLSGQVLWETVSQDAEGNTVIDPRPVVVLRRSSLTRVPADGEKWAFEIPTGPRANAATATYVLERASEGGSSIGFIRFYLRAAEQSA